MAPSEGRRTPWVVELRASLFQAVRGFFESRGFVEVDTPSIVPSPGLDAHLRAFEVRDPSGERVGWLATSPEYQMKRLLCEGCERVFQLTRSFRAEEQGDLHEREFAMLEWYRAEATSKDLMADTEALVRHAARALEARHGLSSALSADVPWESVTVARAVEEHAGLDLTTLRDEESFFRVWIERVQPKLGLDRPVFVVEWPQSMASLAKLQPNGMADRFEAFVNGIELCNGFGELTDPVEQRRRFEHDQERRREMGQHVYPIDERFLEALGSGMPESSGNALGLDRLLMLLTGKSRLQSVMTFPLERL